MAMRQVFLYCILLHFQEKIHFFLYYENTTTQKHTSKCKFQGTLDGQKKSNYINMVTENNFNSETHTHTHILTHTHPHTHTSSHTHTHTHTHTPTHMYLAIYGCRGFSFNH